MGGLFSIRFLNDPLHTHTQALFIKSVMSWLATHASQFSTLTGKFKLMNFFIKKRFLLSLHTHTGIVLVGVDE
jgi:hypothetical protein